MATFLYTEINVAHKGDSAASFPSNGAVGLDGIRVRSNGEELPTAGYSEPQKLSVSGVRLQPYNAIRQEKAMGEVYPGTEITGWVGVEIAANYNVDDLELRVIWNNKPFGDDGEKTMNWAYTSKSKVSVSDIEENSTIPI